MVFAFAGWCAVFFVLMPLVALGPESSFSFLGQITELAFSKQRAARGSNSQFFFNVVTRWTAVVGFQGESHGVLLRTAGLLIVEVNLALSFLLMWLKTARSMEWSFVLLFLSLPFLVATSWPHYLVYLPFCQLFLFSVLFDRSQELKKPVSILVATSLCLSVVASSVIVLQFVGGWSVYNSAGFLFLADAVMLGMSYGVLVPHIRRHWGNPLPHS